MTRSPPNPWLMFPQKNPHARLRLFCFAYAGGGAHLFYSWPQQLPDWVEVVAIQLPGRGARTRESALTCVQDIAAAISAELPPWLDKPCAFFGHSLGAVIAFETIHALRGQHLPLPHILFPAGRQAPQIQDPAPPTHHLPDAAFMQALARLKGTPQAVLQNAELMRIVLPALRADFTAGETYHYVSQPVLPRPIVLFGGDHDSVPVEHAAMQGWRKHTSDVFSYHSLPGDHFFIHSDEARLLALLSMELNNLRLGTS